MTDLRTAFLAFSALVLVVCGFAGFSRSVFGGRGRSEIALPMHLAWPLLWLRQRAIRRELATRVVEPASSVRVERAERARGYGSAAMSYSVAGIALVVGLLVALTPLAPASGYAIICLALVLGMIVDQLTEERAPRRRAAILGRPRGIETVLAVWLVLTALSPLLLLPLIAGAGDRFAIVAVIVCVEAMVAVAWRVATAPPLLFGDDIQAEQRADRTTRTMRTGMACVLALGTIMALLGFAGAPQSSFDFALAAWAGLALWQALYRRHLTRLPLAS